MTGERDSLQASIGASSGGLTAGQMLRMAREEAGLHLATLAAVLKVPPQRLEALEADRYDQLPGMAFVRGVAASFARTVKLDVNQVLALLPKTDAEGLKYDHAVSAVSARRGLPAHGASFGGKSIWPRVLTLLVVVLLVAAAIILFWPQLRPLLGAATSAGEDFVATASSSSSPALATGGGTPEQGAPAATGAVLAGSMAPLTPLAPASAPASASVPDSAAAGASATAPAGQATGTSSGVLAPLTPAATQAVQSQAVVAKLDQPGAALTTTNLSPSGVLATPSSGTLVFNAKGESWIEVMDVNRLPLLRRTLQAGERVAVSGNEPLSVTVGHVENVGVELRGQPYDLKPYKRGNVARFQVK